MKSMSREELLLLALDIATTMSTPDETWVIDTSEDVYRGGVRLRSGDYSFDLEPFSNAGKQRIKLSGVYNDLWNFTPSKPENPTPTLAANRKPADFVRDIRTRLLPDYKIRFDAAQEAKRAKVERVSLSHSNAERVVSASGGLVSYGESHNQYDQRLKLHSRYSSYVGSGVYRMSVSGEVCADDCEIKIAHLPIEAGERVLRLLSEIYSEGACDADNYAAQVKGKAESIRYGIHHRLQWETSEQVMAEIRTHPFAKLEGFAFVADVVAKLAERGFDVARPFKCEAPDNRRGGCKLAHETYEDVKSCPGAALMVIDQPRALALVRKPECLKEPMTTPAPDAVAA